MKSLPTAFSSTSLSFKRQSDTFQILVKGTNTNGYEDYIYPEKWNIASICDNYDYGWYKRGNTVYVPSANSSYVIGNDTCETMTYGKWMVTFQSVNNKLIVSDMTDATSGTIVTTEETMPFTSNVNMLTQTHRTESGNGIICIEATNIDQCVIIDIRAGSSFSANVHSWKRACCIWGTYKIAYISDVAGDNNVYIYNLTTNDIEGDPIPFPSGVTDIPHLFGHTNYVWMTNGSTFGYVCDIRTPSSRNPVAFTYSGLYGSGLQTVKYTCVDDVFIVYKTDEYGSTDIPKAHYIKLSDPTNPMAMTAYDANISSTNGRIDFVLRYVNKYTDIGGNDRSTLLLLINRGLSRDTSSAQHGADCRVSDFGQYLWTGNAQVCRHTIRNNFSNLCLFGDNLIFRISKKIPAINYLPIKFNCRTDTINAMKYTKNITEKSWLISYTNIPLWGDGTANPSGKPPGTPLATTDGNGLITGWS